MTTPAHVDAHTTQRAYPTVLDGSNSEFRLPILYTVWAGHRWVFESRGRRRDTTVEPSRECVVLSLMRNPETARSLSADSSISESPTSRISVVTKPEGRLLSLSHPARG